MLFCFYAKEEERLYYEIEKFVQDFCLQNPEIKPYKIEEVENEVPLKISSSNLFGEKFLYYCPLVEKMSNLNEFLNQLLEIYEKKQMSNYFLFGILEDISHPIFKKLKENQRFYSFESIKYDKEWSKLADNIIDEILKKNKKSLNYEGKIMLKERCKGEPIRLKKELEKICLYSKKEKIETETIKKMCDEESSEAFGLKKAIEKRDVKLFLDQIKKLLREGEPPILILSIISKELKFLIILKALLKKEETILSREHFFQKIYPFLKENAKRIDALEENYSNRFKNPNALFYSYEALSNYELAELIEMQRKINDYNLKLREGFLPEELIYNFCFEIIKDKKGDKWKAEAK